MYVQSDTEQYFFTRWVEFDLVYYIKPVDNPLNENLDKTTISKSMVNRVLFTTIYTFIIFLNSVAVKFLFGDYNSVN